MKKFLICTGLAIVLLAGLPACSGNSEVAEKDKGAIEKVTDKVAAEAVSKIRTPINRAQATRNLGDDRLKAMDEALNKQ